MSSSDWVTFLPFVLFTWDSIQSSNLISGTTELLATSFYHIGWVTFNVHNNYSDWILKCFKNIIFCEVGLMFKISLHRDYVQMWNKSKISVNMALPFHKLIQKTDTEAIRVEVIFCISLGSSEKVVVLEFYKWYRWAIVVREIFVFCFFFTIILQMRTTIQ